VPRWPASRPLNRLELSREEPTRYHKIAYEAGSIEALLAGLFLESQTPPPQQIILDLDATDDPLHGHQEGRYVAARFMLLLLV
jgi:hypothetical protein